MWSIRSARATDIQAIAKVDVETWQTTYPGMLPDNLLMALDPRQRARQWSRFIAHRPGDTLIAVDEREHVLGFGSCGPQRETLLPYAGEIFTLYVAPDYQGQGVGRQLLVALFQRMIRGGLGSAMLWVLAANPSRYFYERVGGRRVADRLLDMGSFGVPAVAYGWPDLADAVRRAAGARSRID
ncbi:putative N-acetyltransferase YuaI [Aliidongia dinghuensis]|uniref:Putative N-acetyltransferase YuaI n=1 Tax=Aliidongia dinghuensis TaxID=1867774 RepID=A0A8J3E3U5_9PROT|nr:GNAT family N-acetyltransferase [Aliidongia dinghuensis]GGF33413.1 putative N-acetyltransferase YuaI [Aliidongia dinghuensis]